MAYAKTLCKHGSGYSYCKPCKSEYDLEYKEKRQEAYYKWLESIGCECCGFSHRFSLELHHLASEYKRFGRSQSHGYNREDHALGTGILLCGNCHNIFHGIFGGKANPFPKLTKEDTIKLITKERDPK